MNDDFEFGDASRGCGCAVFRSGKRNEGGQQGCERND